MARRSAQEILDESFDLAEPEEALEAIQEYSWRRCSELNAPEEPGFVCPDDSLQANPTPETLASVRAERRSRRTRRNSDD